MATLTELSTLTGSPGDPLSQKIIGALLVAANTIAANGSATANQKAWARECLQSPGAFLTVAINAVIASNNTAAVAAIQGATDTQVQTAVNAVLPILTG